MPCPVCGQPIDAADHRSCIFHLFESNTIQSIEEWQALARPVTIVKGRVRARIPREPLEPAYNGSGTVY